MKKLISSFLALLLMASPAYAGASRSFDGANDNINFGDVPAIDDATACSMLVWVFNNNVTQDHSIFETFPGTGNAGILFFADDVGTDTVNTDIYRIRLSDGSNSRNHECATGTSKANQWQWVAWGYDGAGTILVLIDGVQDTTTESTAGTGNVTSMGGTNNSVIIGESLAGTRDRSGNLAYLQVWNRKLTADEFRQAALMPGSIVGGLVLFAPFFGVDSPETDLSSTKESGTVNGAGTSASGPPVYLTGGAQ